MTKIQTLDNVTVIPQCSVDEATNVPLRKWIVPTREFHLPSFPMKDDRVDRLFLRDYHIAMAQSFSDIDETVKVIRKTPKTIQLDEITLLTLPQQKQQPSPLIMQNMNFVTKMVQQQVEDIVDNEMDDPVEMDDQQQQPLAWCLDQSEEGLL